MRGYTRTTYNRLINEVRGIVQTPNAYFENGKINFFSLKNLGIINSYIHVLVTSYYQDNAVVILE